MKKKEIEIKSSGGKGNKRAEISFRSDFSIHNVQEIKPELEEIMDKYEQFHFILNDQIETLDLAGLQILIAFQKSATSLGKKVSFEVHLNPNLAPIIQHSGITLS